ncbi:MAG: hypothetical protein H7A33_05315 [Deltaproteobacteria bacterium]|nr:hypothetical protein [Deltaproteobacteria bacterium]
MKATTIKLEGDLLKYLNRHKPRKESLSSFVRQVLEGYLEEQRAITAAKDYNNFLQKNPEEEEWLEEWGNADLSEAPKTAKKKGQK